MLLVVVVTYDLPSGIVSSGRDNAGRLTYARLCVVILQFQSQGQSDTVLAALLWQDHLRGIRYQHRYAAVTFHPRSVVI